MKVLRNLILHYHERLLRGGFNEWEIEIRIYLTPETYNKMKIEASKRLYSFQLENKKNTLNITKPEEIKKEEKIEVKNSCKKIKVDKSINN